MDSFRKQFGWIVVTILGSALFAFGFSCFLMPNDISPGGISGLALVAVELLGGGSVGSLAGMYLFRHKTQHLRFTLGIPLILAAQCFVVVLVMALGAK